MRYFKIGEVPSTLYDSIGGKALGLDFLVRNGFNVPNGYILTDLETLNESDYDTLNKIFDDMNVKLVSVRSSATNEDCLDFSSAGQYDTCLNVCKSHFIESIKSCINSLNSDRVKAYSETFKQNSTNSMNIVVQEMINAEFAGVMFTSDPMNKENVLIEVVEGLGENLVSGIKTADRLSFNVNDEFVNNTKVSDVLIKQITTEGLEIAKIYGNGADLEFAIINDTLYWLQLRAITTNEMEVDLDEFNPKNDLENHLLTSRNIGEMMPGAVTPLSISTSVLAIDYGIRNMLRVIGHIKKCSDRPDYYCALAIKNHLFIDLSALHTMTKSVIGTDAASMNLSILGEYLEDYPEVSGKKANIFKRLINGIKFGKYLFSSKKAKKYILNLEKNLNFIVNDNASVKEIHDEITSKLYTMNEALSCHYVCSSFSGAMNSALYMTLADSFNNKAEYQAFISTLLLDIDGIESADILKQLNKMAKLILDKNENAKAMSNVELLAYVSNKDNVEINNLYNEFISRHGHRSIKEAELRSKAWKNNPLLLMQNLHTVILSSKLEEEKAPFDLEAHIKDFKKKGAVRWIANNARQAVRDREFSKSIIIKVIDKFKDRYILLADRLVKEGYLSDSDSIYFLTNDEITDLINGDTRLMKKAIARRVKFKESEDLRFLDVVIGEPKPIEQITLSEDKTLYGIPVCKGKVYGKVRVVKSQEDALLIEKDEIMIAPFTDIGWSPYYSMVSALITEVGSALSHGAVVAREYSLPTIVNVKNATFNIKTGDYAYVNADNGSITIITKEEYELVKGREI